ncbi:MAG: NAD(P)/FAD-dependent oxidoreductase [Gammaproteobacteria bacterium]
MPLINSYYTATAHAWKPRPALDGTVRCDVCVVGGGIAGCAAALHLAERGYDVVLLEAERIGWGASGRSGGQVIFGFARDIDRMVELVGAPDARRLWDMSLAGVDLVKSLIARHGIACDWRDGQCHVAIKPRHVTELREWQRLLEGTYDYPLEFLDAAALRAVLASPRYRAGLYDARGGHLHPLNYTRGLALAAVRAGARLFEDSRVTACRLEGLPEARTARGTVRARSLVFAGNAYLNRLVPPLADRIMPVGTYIAATAPLGAARARALITNDMAVSDLNFVLDYFRLSADHRLLFGGRVSYSTVPPPNLHATMRARIRRVFPDLAAVPLEYAWGGYVDITLNRAPDFGRLAPDVYYVQGFSGHGLALAGLAGQLVAEAVAGTQERFDVFARIPHREFPGGRLLRVPALLLGTLYYRLRDLF